MENASKALIIAGAILLAILIISLGIFIFGQAQDTINSGGISKAEISSFNAQFTKYEGIKRGSDVKSLIQEVNTSNVTDMQEGNGRQIKIEATLKNGKTWKTEGDGTANAYSYTTADIASTGKFKVDIGYSNSTGYVDTITITQQ